MFLLTGLGNPGPRYDGTRHNIGFAVMDCLASRHEMTFGSEKFGSRVARGAMGGASVLLAKPQSFMNLSGTPVRRLMDYFKIPLSRLLVLHDDMDLAMGWIKIVAKGGAGGHKGVASIIEALGDDTVARIKVGIGRPDPVAGGVDHVLGRFSEEDQTEMEQAVNEAADAAECFVEFGLVRAQQEYNRRDRRLARTSP